MRCLLEAFDDEEVNPNKFDDYQLNEIYDRLYRAVLTTSVNAPPEGELRAWIDMVSIFSPIQFEPRDFVDRLGEVVRRWEASEISLERGEVVKAMVDAMTSPEGPGSTILARPSFTSALIEMMIPLDRAETAAWCDEAAEALVGQIARPIESAACREYSEALSKIAEGLEAERAREVCSEAAGTILACLKARSGQIEVAGELKIDAGALFVWPLSFLAPKMARAEARQMAVEVAELMMEGLTADAEPGVINSRARSIARLADIMEPDEASDLCREANEKLLAWIQIERSETWGDEWIAEALSDLAAHMKPSEAAGACDAIISLIFQRSNNWDVRHKIVVNLVAAIQYMERETATTLLANAFVSICNELESIDPDNNGHNYSVSASLKLLAAQLQSTEVAEMVAQSLAHQLPHTSRSNRESDYLETLKILLPPETILELILEFFETGQNRLYKDVVLAESALNAMKSMEGSIFTDINAEHFYKVSSDFMQPSSSYDEENAAILLASVACHLEPELTAQSIRAALRSLLPENHVYGNYNILDWRHPNREPIYSTRGMAIAALLTVIDPSISRPIAIEMTRLVCSQPLWYFSEFDVQERRKTLLEKLSCSYSCLESLALIARFSVSESRKPGMNSTSPVPCHLTTPELVELLKMPTCLDSARRFVLDQLGNRYGRRFDNHWQFVRFAEEQGLGLDFESPPVRPDPVETFRRIAAILEE